MISAFLRNFFGFNKQQRNGLYVLVTISFLLLLARLAMPVFISPSQIVLRNLPLIERKFDSAYKASGKYSAGYSADVTKETKLFYFDPNVVTAQQLSQLGFSEKRAAIFLKFRNRGFVFKKKEDLLRVFGISGRFYESLAPYVRISAKNNAAAGDNNLYPPGKAAPGKQEVTVVELNSADSSALEKLRGIGPAFAKRILKYRSMLGGYTGIDQLREVYGLDAETYEKIKPNVRADASMVKKLNINTDDFKTVNKHPYLSFELTKSVFNARRKNTLTPEALRGIMANDSLYFKLLPYLVFD